MDGPEDITAIKKNMKIYEKIVKNYIEFISYLEVPVSLISVEL